MTTELLTPEGILHETFGYQEFRPHQREIVEAVLNGRDILAVMPTSAGKSLCYQIPALLMDGVAVVISPLISLMADQVSALSQLGVPTAFVNSTLSPREQDEVLNLVALGYVRLLYLAPERLDDTRLLVALKSCGVSLVAVDEAHCISQWGNDFRPSYQRIRAFVDALGTRPPVCALTATATGIVRRDIVSSLGLVDPLRVVASFDRPNLHFAVERPRDSRDKMRRLVRLINDAHGASGIVYCQSRRAVEDVTEELRSRGIPAARYHAGLTTQERTQAQDDFIYDRVQVIVATNAFGMGIDKPDVSFVAHYNLPLSMEAYYQEAGRAGRDGTAATCLLLYSPGDVHTAEYLISQLTREDLTEQETRDLIAHDSRRLRDMVRYAGSTGCLRHQLLAYFGEDSPDACGNCGNCETDWEEVDRSIEALKVVSCVARLDQRHATVGATMVVQILRGSHDQKLLQRGFDTLSTYGIMSDVSTRAIHELLDELVLRGILARTEGAYPVITLTGKSRDFLRACTAGEEPFVVRVAKEKPKATREPVGSRRGAGAPAGTDVSVGATTPCGAPVDEELYDLLRQLRLKLAREQDVPPYIIFNNATLEDLCRRLPRSSEELLDVTGIGQTKADRYGRDILSTIAHWREGQSGVEANDGMGGNGSSEEAA